MTSDRRSVDLVVLSVCAEEPNVDEEDRSIFHGDDQTVVVAADVEDDAVPGDEVRGAVPRANLCRTIPRSGLDLMEPRAQRLFRIAVALPESDQGGAADDSHMFEQEVSTIPIGDQSIPYWDHAYLYFVASWMVLTDRVLRSQWKRRSGGRATSRNTLASNGYADKQSCTDEMRQQVAELAPDDSLKNKCSAATLQACADKYPSVR